MARIAVQFVATGNMQALSGQIAAVNAQMAAMSKTMNGMGASGANILSGIRANMERAVNAGGAWTAQTMKVATSTAVATDMIRKQEVTWGNYNKAVRGNVDEIVRQQVRLQNAQAMTWASSGAGMRNATGTLLIPNSVPDSMKHTNMRASVLNQTMQSMAQNGIKLGKNMQWSGRQLTVGLTLPIVALGYVAAKSAREIDAAMTRLIKVYGDLGGTSDAELERVRNATMETSRVVAEQYGIMARDTVSLGAELAAQGFSGDDLQKQIKETSRIMMLGEIDQQTALKGTVVIRQVFNKTAEESEEIFNRLNAIENATTITTDELLMAIPKAAGAVKQAGGSVEYLSAMLAAMRENGVSDISRAANSISSSMIAIAKPVPQTIEMFNAVGVSIADMASRHKGNLQGLMEELARLWTQMDATQRLKLFGQLFGKHRYKEMSELLSSIAEQLNEGSMAANAYGTSLNVIAADSATVAKAADTEIERMRKSASKQFDILKARLNSQIAEFGVPLMQVFNNILKPIIALLSAFNAMPSSLKFLAVLFLGITALVGPIVMLLGLFINFGNQVFQAFLKARKLIFGFKELETEQQRLAAITAGTTTPALRDQMVQTERLMGSVKALTAAMEQQIATAQRAAAAQATAARATATAAAATARAQKAATTQATATAAAQQRRQDRYVQPTYGTGVNGQALGSVPMHQYMQQSRYAPGGSTIAIASGNNGKLLSGAPVGVTPGASRPVVIDTRTARRLEESKARSAGGTFAERKAERIRINELRAVNQEEARAAEQRRKEALDREKTRRMDLKHAEALRMNNAMMVRERAAAMSGQLGGLLLISGMLTTILGQNKQWAVALGQVLTVLAVILMMFPQILSGIAAIGLTSTGMLATVRAAAITTFAGIRAGFTALFLSLPGAAFVAAFAAIFATYKLWRNHQKGVAEEAKDAGFAARDLADDLSISWSQTAGAMTPARKELEKIEQIAEDLKKGSKDSLDTIKDRARSASREAEKAAVTGGGGSGSATATATTTTQTAADRDENEISPYEQSIIQQTRTIAVQWILHGADPNTAREKVRALLTALGQPELEIEVDFSLSDAKDRAQVLADEANRIFDAATKKRRNWAGFDEQGIDRKQVPAIQAAMDDAAQAITPGLGADEIEKRQEARDAITSHTELMRSRWLEVTKSLVNNQKALDAAYAAGYEKNAAGLADYMANHVAAGRVVGGVFKGIRKEARAAGEAEEIAAKRFAERVGVTAEDLPSIKEQVAVDSDEAGNTVMETRNRTLYTTEGIVKALNDRYKTAGDLQAAYNKSIAESTAAGVILDEEQKNQIATNLALQYGLKGIISSSVVAGKVQQDLKKAVEDAGGAGLEAVEDWNKLADSLKSKLQANSSAALQKYVDDTWKAYDKATEAAEKGYDDQIDASDARWDKEIDKQAEAFDAREKKIKDDEKTAKDAAKKIADDAVDKIEDQLDKADELDKKREEMFQAELTRMQRLSERANAGIDFNIALNSGNLDEAARLMNAGEIRDVKWNMEDAAQGTDENSKRRRKAGEVKIDQIRDREDKATNAADDVAERKRRELEEEEKGERAKLEASKKADRERLENQKKAYRAGRDALKDSVNEQVALIVEGGARSAGEFVTQAGNIRGIFEKNKVALAGVNKKWNEDMAGQFKKAVDDSAIQMENDRRWESFGANIANMMASGATGGQMTWDQVLTYLSTGKKPDPVSPNASTGGFTPGSPAHFRYAENNPTARHTGGPVGSAVGSRAGRPMHAGLYKDEVPTILQQGEYVIQRKAVKAVGKETLDKINQGKGKPGMYRHGGGFLGGAAASIAMTMMGRMTEALNVAVRRKDEELMAAGTMPSETVFGASQPIALESLPAVAGKYGDYEFSEEQLSNAAKIVSVGRSMGASHQDLVIGIMTALQESTLRNLPDGDRDSVGLFQQRPSQGWGTPQQIMVPEYSSRKFFEQLLRIPGRDRMRPTEAAQKVQRSAFPEAYARWENEAQAIVAATSAAPVATDVAVPQNVKFVPGLSDLQAPDSDQTWRRGPGNWHVGLAPGVVPAVAGILAGIPGGQIITSAFRTPEEQMQANRRVKNSDHSRGKAVDIAARSRVMGGSVESEAAGDLIAGSFKSLPSVKQVLWKTYVGGNHHDHVHVAFRHGGGEVEEGEAPMRPALNVMGAPTGEGDQKRKIVPQNLAIGSKPTFDIPGLRTGGMVLADNTIANLHKNEAVLTAPLTQKLQEGITNMDNSKSAVYNVNITAGAGIDTRSLAREVRLELEKFELRKGTNRRVGS